MKWAKNAIKLPDSNGGVPDFGHFGSKMAILGGPIFFRAPEASTFSPPGPMEASFLFFSLFIGHHLSFLNNVKVKKNDVAIS